ncbi:hypothetical protein LTR37_003431 [Vermiconidia calcicola]|uniref:Uncharacterized protein n=1 Tax=Vermiconidia calcicola TaxID=1690605 RepID=A0ACC3NQS4_9PEZI|nr:hypothetical protein LTR37_003431 [Vermiconidia calcicola]
MAAASSGSSVDAIRYRYHHVFLPADLPQEDDLNDRREAQLLRTTIDSLTALNMFLPQDGRIQHVQKALKMLKLMEKVHSGGVTEAEFLRAMEQLVDGDISISLHVRAQNAGALISKTDDGRIQFDFFELLPTNKAVMTTQGRLQRSFPATVVIVPMDVFRQQGFQKTVAHTLANMSSQAVVGMQPQARKAGSLHDEDRDTTHPGIVTELFAGFLSAVGNPTAVSEIFKNTREDVL